MRGRLRRAWSELVKHVVSEPHTYEGRGARKTGWRGAAGQSRERAPPLSGSCAYGCVVCVPPPAGSWCSWAMRACLRRTCTTLPTSTTGGKREEAKGMSKHEAQAGLAAIGLRPPPRGVSGPRLLC